MLSLTDTALAALRGVLDDTAGGGVRIAVESGGCAGLRYRLAVEDGPADGDAVVCLGSVKLFVDAASEPLLEGVVVDFVDGPAGTGLVFQNPNAPGGCACGKSCC